MWWIGYIYIHIYICIYIYISYWLYTYILLVLFLWKTLTQKNTKLVVRPDCVWHIVNTQQILTTNITIGINICLLTHMFPSHPKRFFVTFCHVSSWPPRFQQHTHLPGLSACNSVKEVLRLTWCDSCWTQAHHSFLSHVVTNQLI